MWITGAENTVSGQKQYEAYCRHTRMSIEAIVPSEKTFKFGNRTTKSLGIATIRFPFDDDGSFFEYPSDIVAIDVPLLFGLDLMKRFKVRIDKVDNKFKELQQGWSAKLIFKNRYLYREWPKRTITFSKTELEKLRRRIVW